MWTRAELKDRAKMVLKQNYWKGVLAYLIYNAIYGAVFFVLYICAIIAVVVVVIASAQSVPAVVICVIICFVIMIAILIVTVYPVIVGLYKYFIEASVFKPDLKNVLFAFKDGNFFYILKAMLWEYLFVFLWSLLLYIPGIVKAISYSMVPFILTDNPKIGHKRALKLSMQMTQGQKWDIFILELSFIGWMLLGAITGIGIIFVMPYYLATISELYAKLRLGALVNGYCTAEELNIGIAAKTIN